MKAVKDGSIWAKGLLRSGLGPVTGLLRDRPHHFLPYFTSATSELEILKQTPPHRDLLRVVHICLDLLGIYKCKVQQNCEIN